MENQKWQNYHVLKISKSPKKVKLALFRENLSVAKNACEFWFGLLCHFQFCSSKMFFDIDRDQKKSLQFVLRKENAFCIALDSFLQQKEFIEVRLLYGFRQDCRKTTRRIIFFQKIYKNN